jgi:predicted O-linked N-acetylglucosamine transferase (SPINDLY family)
LRQTGAFGRPFFLVEQAMHAIGSGWWTDARDLLEQARQLDGRRPDVLVNLGLACLNTGAPGEAAAMLKKAVSLRPDIPAAHSNLGLALSALGRHRDAVASLVRAVRLAPGHAPLLHDLGVVCAAAGDAPAAIDAFGKALALEPGLVEARFNLGNLRHGAGQSDAAEAAWRAVLAQAPGHLPAALNLGSLLLGQKRADEALRVFDAILPAHAGMPALHNGRGNALHDLGRLDEALDAFERAATLDPDSAEIRYNLANQRLQLGHVDAAIDAFRQVLQLDPAHAQAAQNLLFTLNYPDAVPAQEVARMHRALAQVAAGVGDPAAGVPNGARRSGGRAADTDVDAVAARPAKRVAAPSLPGDGRMRIGFVSADLRTHSVAWFLLPLLEALDRERFEVHCFTNSTLHDTMSARLQAASDGWHAIAALDDAAAADCVREQGIGLLVDLSGHSAGQRLGMFTRRPAPRLATWLGYPNTTGLEAIDVRLVDAITDPDDAATQALASERLLRIDGCFVCHRPPPDAPPVTMRRAGGEGGPIVFGSFNTLQKISASTLDLWCALLAAEPGSLLALKAGSLEQPGVQARLRAALEARGIDPSRLQCLPRDADVPGHLSRYAGIDVALDTWPYHGTTTTCEALWMGVPVVTLVGDRHASRVGASLLTAAGCPQWIAHDRDAYVAAARAAAHHALADPTARQRLRDQLAASRLHDSARFASAFAAALGSDPGA